MDQRVASALSDKRLEVLEQLLRLAGGDLKATLAQATDVIAEVSRSDKVDAFLYDRGRDCLVAVGSSTQPLSMKQRELGLDVLQISNGGRVVHVFQTGETYLNGRLDEDRAELLGIREGLKIKSKLGVPLVIGGQRRGMMMLASLKYDFYSTEDARFMETAAPWIGLVAHRAELAAEIALNAAEQGRRAGAEELITVLAHDLRNYLAPINMRVNVLRMRAEQERREDELRDIDLLSRSIDRLGELVTDILDVSRIDQGVFQIQPRRIELAGLVHEVVATFQSAQHAIKLTVQQGDDVRVSGDPARLRQCLENVIANAIQKSPVTGTINLFVRMRQRPSQREAVVEVIDEGPGIPAEQIAHIFDRFHSGRAGGLGLGLYLAKRIARVHGGDLTADSEPGKGARFTLSLPALATDV